MRNKRKQLGVTLVEMMVVVGIAALMVGLTIPMANMLLNSFESENGAKSIISSAMASARAIAAKEQRYAGIRFQKRYDPNNPVDAPQYIIFIINEKDRNLSGGLASGFRAVEGIQPIKLPDSIGVMDLIVRKNWTSPGDNFVDAQPINDNTYINSFPEVNDTTAFSIVFSPSGKLVFHKVRVRNRDGHFQPLNLTDSSDDIFNSPDNIINSNMGMFIQDDYAYLGYGSEMSRNNFVVYDTKKFKQTDVNLRWTNYLSQLKPIYINPYTGTIITQ